MMKVISSKTEEITDVTKVTDDQQKELEHVAIETESSQLDKNC